MSTTGGRRLFAAVSFFLFAVPCRADIAPESGLLAHVQSVSSGWDWCYSSPISDCHQIIRSTMQDGEVEFVLFFMRGSVGSGGETLCLQSIHTVLTWPPAWQLVTFEPCATWYGSLDPNGTTHALHLFWADDPLPIGDGYGSVVPVARLVMNVVGPGRLDFTSYSCQAALRHDCYGASFVTYSVQIYAEAGMQCGHISAHCGYRENLCEPHFYVEELHLSAPYGGTADSTVSYWAAGHVPFDLCPVTVDTHAPWCTARVDSVGFYEARLHVTADAAGLAPDGYETAIELSADGAGVSRCLPVVFTVEEQPTATSAVSWGRVKALYR